VGELRKVDPTSDRPVYKQIADALREAIERGDFPPGSRLPSESELMDRYSVAQGTVRNALGVLRGEGHVVAEHGRGVFVRSRPRQRRLAHDRFARRHREAGKAAYLAEAEAEGADARVDVFYVGPDKAPERIAGLLGLRPGTKVLVRRRRYLTDDRPTELATSYIPWSLAQGTPMVNENPGPGGVYARIEETGRQLVRFTEDVTARMPAPEESQALRLAAATPVFHLLRVAYDESDTAVEVCDTVMSADEWVLSYELPAT
jgi:GntR family transcriptional regulator